MSLAMRTASRVLLGLPYRDTQCGFKLFPRDISHDLFSQQRSTGWTFGNCCVSTSDVWPSLVRCAQFVIVPPCVPPL